MLAYARIALAKSRSKWAAWLSSQRLPSVISTERFLRVISTERSEWRNLDKMLIFNRFLDYALCAPLEMTIIPNLSPRFSVARGDPDLREIHPATAIIDYQLFGAEISLGSHQFAFTERAHLPLLPL